MIRRWLLALLAARCSGFAARPFAPTGPARLPVRSRQSLELESRGPQLNAYHSNLKTVLRHAVARRNDIPKRLPAVPGPARHCQADPAVVRRRGSGVGDLPGLLPVGAAVRLCLFRLDDAAAHPAQAGLAAHCAARREPSDDSDHPRGALEARRRWRGTLAADTGPARRHDRPAIFPAFDHEPSGASLVLAELPACRAVPAVRAVEFRIAARPAFIPGAGRAFPAACRAVVAMVHRLLRLRAVVRGDRAPKHARTRRRSSAGRAGRRPRGEVSRHRGPIALDCALCDGFVPAARRYQPPDAEHCIDPVPVGGAARRSTSSPSSCASTIRAGTTAGCSSRSQRCCSR